MMLSVGMASGVSAMTCDPPKIKGLVSQGDPSYKYYLLPAHPFYKEVKELDPKRGERCFKSKQEAEKAGFVQMVNPKPSSTETTKSLQGKAPITYERMTQGLEEFAFVPSPAVDGKPRMSGKTEEGDATIDMLGEPQKIVSTTLLLNMSKDSLEFSTKHTQRTRIFLANAVPEWPGCFSWAIETSYQLITIGTEGEQTTITGNKTLRVRWMPVPKRLSVTVEVH
jgi:hypothetical protein